MSPGYQDATQDSIREVHSPRESNNFITEKKGDILVSERALFRESRSFGRDTANSQSTYRRTLWRNFAPDVGRWFAAVSIFLAIAITLGKYNGEPVPRWKFAINLNSLVALLTTFMRASMTAVVSECK
jgi:hypothetical protein